MPKLVFYPLGNADCYRMDLANGEKLLFDYADTRCRDDKDDKRVDLPAELRKDLNAAGRKYYDVVAFSHLDQDHTCGSSEFFYLEHDKKYQSDDRIKINELWVPAAVGSRALRVALDSEDAAVAVWQAGEDGSVRALRVSPSPAVVERKGDWTIRTDERLLEKARAIRSEKLPNETGGVLIGAFDTHHRVVYVVDVLPAPPDSREQPTGFIRGFHGLTESVERIEKVTAGQLTYVGEWHSHPLGHGVTPSADYDRKLFEWLRAKMAADGLPPLMLIVGDRGRHGWYLEAMLGKGRGAR